MLDIKLMDECIICFELIDTNTQYNHFTSCEHGKMMHLECANKWINKSKINNTSTCPICRTIIKVKKPFDIILICNKYYILIIIAFISIILLIIFILY